MEKDEELLFNSDEDELITLSKDLENISFENTMDLSEYIDKTLEFISKNEKKKSET